MKKIIFIIFVIFFSCTENSLLETKKGNIEKYVLKNINNPKSYEFVEIYDSDTIYKLDFLKNKIDSLFNTGNILDEEIAIKPNFKNQYEKDLYERKDSMKKIEKEKSLLKLNELKRIKKITSKEEIINFKTVFSFRQKNEFNATVKTNYLFLIDKDMKIVKRLK